MKKHTETFSPLTFAALFAALLATALLCICVGSVDFPLGDTLSVLLGALTRRAAPADVPKAVILSVRLPRVLCAGLTGAALSLSGAAMQGLLRNPLADGSTLGVSSGAALGAVVALALGLSIPGAPYAAVTLLAMLGAFLSLLLILALACVLDRSLATDSIILIGVIFSMFASSLISLITAFAGEKIKTITFWTMGSFSGCSMAHAALLASALLLCGTVLLRLSGELNAFAIGEENALHIGVSVRRVKLVVLIAVSALIGVCVSVGGAIAFVGLITPHMTRMLVGPNHRRLLPACLFSGAIFMLLSDLVGRTLLRPIELPVGVVTSLIGATAFLLIFLHGRRES